MVFKQAYSGCAVIFLIGEIQLGNVKKIENSLSNTLFNFVTAKTLSDQVSLKMIWTLRFVWWRALI